MSRLHHFHQGLSQPTLIQRVSLCVPLLGLGLVSECGSLENAAYQVSINRLVGQMSIT